MAIEIIANPKEAYQGSVPKVDAPTARKSAKKQPGPRITEAKAADASVKKTADGTVSVIKDVPVDENGNADYPKNEEYSAGTEAMRKAVDEINRHIKHSEIVFGIHDKTNRTTIKIVDKDSRRVVREFPPEQTLDMIAKIWEIAGIMVDEKG